MKGAAESVVSSYVEVDDVRRISMVGALVAGVRGDLHIGGVGCLADAVGAGGGLGACSQVGGRAARRSTPSLT